MEEDSPLAYENLVAQGFAHMRRNAELFQLHDETGYLDISKDGILLNLDRTAAGLLLDRTFRKLSKKMHPDIRKDGATKTEIDSDFSDLNNVHRGLQRLNRGEMPDNSYFKALKIEPPIDNVQLDTSGVSGSRFDLNVSTQINRGDLTRSTDDSLKLRVEKELLLYRRARVLGFVAAGLVITALIPMMPLSLTFIGEIVGQLTVGKGLGYAAWDIAAKSFYVAAVVSPPLIVASGVADLCRGKYSELRRGFRDAISPPRNNYG